MSTKTVSESIGAHAADTDCRKIGYFISKGGCFALHGAAGPDVWLEIDPIPLHFLDEEVEVEGQQFGPDLIWVRGIRPTKGWA